MIATIEHTRDGPALLVHGVRVAEKPVGDTTLQALADQINAVCEIERIARDQQLFEEGRSWATRRIASLERRIDVILAKEIL